MTPAGIKPATFRFLAQSLNNCATADNESKQQLSPGTELTPCALKWIHSTVRNEFLNIIYVNFSLERVFKFLVCYLGSF
jgi:hypothetical protein